jgi:hypothetical protein
MEATETNRGGMNPSTDIRHPAVLFASVLAAIITAFLFIAAISPQVNIEIPGVRNCNGASCAIFGSGGGD